MYIYVKIMNKEAMSKMRQQVLSTKGNTKYDDEKCNSCTNSKTSLYIFNNYMEFFYFLNSMPK